MKFEQALEAMKAGSVLRRTGWSSKTMAVVLVTEELPPELDPFFMMLTKRSTIQLGWLASPEDLVASDWEYAKQSALYKIHPSSLFNA